MEVIDLKTKETYSIEVNKTGENTIVCPVCSHTRKKKTDKCFGFNVQKGAGRCNHCGVVLVEKKEFIKKATQIEYKRPLFKSNTNYSLDAVKFFNARCISEKTLLELNVSESFEWMPKNRTEINTINFNYFRYGELINVKYRGKNKDFKLYKDAELIFYNLDALIENNVVIIVEGEMDVLAMYEAGYKNCISVPNGCTEKGNINMDYLDNCIDFISDNQKFILALDNDIVGNRLKEELARRLGYENCYTVTFKDVKDANDCLIKYGIQGIIESIADKKEFPIIGVFDANDIKKEIYDYYNNGLPKGCGIGMQELDNQIRFQEGYLTTITGIPGHGKSEFLDFLLCRLNILNGWKIGLFSPENHPLELHFSKFAEKIIGKPFEGKDKMSPLDLSEMIKYHSKNYFFINPENDFKLEDILNSVKQLVRKKGIKAFVIDAWNKLDHQYTHNETKYISEQLDKIVRFCEVNKVHCFLVAHPTKISKDKKTGEYEIPNLYSISGSANFYNKTANGITVYRDFKNSTTQIFIQKVKFKHWGSVGSVHLAWDKSNGRYYKGMPNNENWLYTSNANTLEANTNFLNDNDIIKNEVLEDPF